MYLYLDESGDLGFNFDNKKPSRYFVITLLCVYNQKAVQIINKAISVTLNKKLNQKKKNRRIVSELKGSAINLDIKKYFLNYLYNHTSDWSLYSIVLDKVTLLKQIEEPIKDRIYNHMTYKILEKIQMQNASVVNLIVDRSKNTLGIKEFNEYLYANLSLCLNLRTKLYITHDCSEKNKGIQAADVFCYGIARKYELEDYSWYDLFKCKIAVEYEFKFKKK